MPKAPLSLLLACMAIFWEWGCTPQQETSSSSPSPVSSQSAEQAPSSQAVSPSTAQLAREVPYTVEDSTQSLELDGGVQVFFIQKGSGVKPNLQRNILFHYHGMLTDGTVFDSSFDRGQPLDSPLRNLIQGWQQALVQVPLGSKVRLIIPPELGYGAQGSTNVPPNATLIFDIELISMY